MASTTFKKPWLKRHVTDPYVKLAQQQGLRSRAAYKLSFIQDKDRLLKPNHTVLDLGAAPGAWSQLAKQYVGGGGKVIAIDRLPMQPIEGVHFIEGDLNTEQTLNALYGVLDAKQVNVVLSDLAPNLGGIASLDQPRSYALVTLAFTIAERVLKQNGSLLVKCFQGKGFELYLKHLRSHFNQVVTRKPMASRACSSEVYLLARGYHT